MLVVSSLPQVEFGRNDHWEDAPHFTIQHVKTPRYVVKSDGRWKIRILHARFRGVIRVLMIYFFFFLDPSKVHLSIWLYFSQRLLSIAFASSEQHSLFLITLRALPLSIRHQLFELGLLSVKIYDKGRARSLWPKLCWSHVTWAM